VDSGEASGESAATEGGAAGSGARLLALAASLVLLAWLTLGQLGHPLIWQDEGETVMFGQRILEYGYPKVHDGRNAIYGMGVAMAHGVEEESDAYIGSLWGQYYFAALGVALAEGIDDLNARTARLRLPFALAGCLGLLLVWLSVAPALARAGSGRLPAAVGYVLMLCTSTSLILHLREARYYALVVLLLGALVWAQRRLAECDGLPIPWIAGTTVLLVLLFNAFYPAAVSVAVWLVLEAALRGARGDGTAIARLRSCAALWLPALLTALLALPFVVWFEMAQLSRLFSERYAFGLATYAANLGAALEFLLRYEWLAPVVAAEVAVFTLHRRSAMPEGQDVLRSTALSLMRLCVVWVGLGARNPIFFERYFVPLSPLLAAILVLDAALLARAGGLVPRRALVVGLVILLLGMVGMKRVELAGHLAQLREPYRGPLDFVIPHLRDAYDDPSALTIATNYEAEPYVYYLGSRVVGRFYAETAEATAAERAARVDVVVPRRGQPRKLDLLWSYLDQGTFERREFPVVDLPYNNIPELDRGRVLTTTHLFRTRPPAEGESPFYIHERVREAPRSSERTEQ
jgi:hypothetical protein